MKKRIKKFNLELKKATNTGMVAAFGFLIALVWRDLIVEYVNEITQVSPIQGKLISAVIVTIICVMGILIIASATKIKE